MLTPQHARLVACNRPVGVWQVRSRRDQRHEFPGDMHVARATRFSLLESQQIKHLVKGQHLASTYINHKVCEIGALQSNQHRFDRVTHVQRLHAITAIAGHRREKKAIEWSPGP